MRKQYIAHRLPLFVQILAIVVAIFPIFSAVAEKSPEVVVSEESKSRSLARSLNLHTHDLLAHAPQDPEYFYAPSTTNQSIATVWTDLAGKDADTEQLRRTYDDFYLACLEYKHLYIMSLIQAKRLINEREVYQAEKEIIVALQYLKLLNWSATGAAETYLGNIDETRVLAQSIYKGSKASAKYGTALMLGPWASSGVDTLYKVTDFAIDLSDLGLNTVEKKAFVPIIVDAMLDLVPLASMKKKTFSEYLTKKTTKVIGSSGIGKILDEIVNSDRFKKSLITILAEPTVHNIRTGSKVLTKRQVLEIIRTLSKLGPTYPLNVYPLTFSFSGTVTNTKDPALLLNDLGIIPDKSTFEGELRYDPATPLVYNRVINSGEGYLPAASDAYYPMGSISVVIDGKYHFASDPFNNHAPTGEGGNLKVQKRDSYIQILNDDRLIGDWVNFITTEFVIFDAPKRPHRYIQMILRDKSSSGLSDSSLPTRLNLSDFDSSTITISATGADKVRYDIKGNITNLVEVH